MALALAALLPACGGGSSGSSGPSVLPDFSLQDANTNSATSGMNVSPRDYLNAVPAFFFGHAG